MRVVPELAVKLGKDVEVGELIRATVSGQEALGFPGSKRDDDNEVTLGVWVQIGEDASISSPSWLDHNSLCVSYGSDWTLEPDTLSQVPEENEEDGVLGLHVNDGWLLKVRVGQSSTQWFSLLSGELIQSVSRRRMVLFRSFKITTKSSSQEQMTVFSFPPQK